MKENGRKEDGNLESLLIKVGKREILASHSIEKLLSVFVWVAGKTYF